MTKKELYKFSVKLSGGVLRDFFDAPEGFSDMENNPRRKKARKNLFDALAPLLLTEEVEVKKG